MPEKIIMPKLGLTATEGTIAQWLKKEGEPVEKGEPVVEIITEKVNYEIESPASGYLIKILAQVDDTVPYGTPIGIIGEPSEDIAPFLEELETPEASAPTLTSLPGEEGQTETTPTLLETQPLRTLPFSGVRKAIAQKMLASHQTTAPVTLVTEADMEALVALREKLLPEIESTTGLRLTYTDIIIKIVSQALKDYPRMNATLKGEEIHLLPNIHIGMATALPEGLIVPVIQNADQKNLKEITIETKRLAQAARQGTLAPEQASGSTFTITNLGPYNIDLFTPIINLPETGILGIGRLQKKPVVVDNEIKIKPMAYLSLTFDHRLLDGAQAAEFLNLILNYLKNPGEIC